jgi:hypothetical protein
LLNPTWQLPLASMSAQVSIQTTLYNRPHCHKAAHDYDRFKNDIAKKPLTRSPYIIFSNI